MPLYEYQCESCSHRFEVIQKFSDAPLEVCPQCGGKVQKQISSPAFQFKGSGWYVTDYAKKSDSGKSDAKTEKSDTTDKSDKSEKSESKSASSDSTSTAKASTGSSTPSTTKSS